MCPVFEKPDPVKYRFHVEICDGSTDEAFTWIRENLERDSWQFDYRLEGLEGGEFVDIFMFDREENAVAFSTRFEA